MLDARGLGEDASTFRATASVRSKEELGELDRDQAVALILLGDEAGPELQAEKRGHRDEGDHQAKAQSELARQVAGKADAAGRTPPTGRSKPCR